MRRARAHLPRLEASSGRGRGHDAVQGRFGEAAGPSFHLETDVDEDCVGEVGRAIPLAAGLVDVGGEEIGCGGGVGGSCGGKLVGEKHLEPAGAVGFLKEKSK